MQDELSADPFLVQLCEGYTQEEVAEIEQYITQWDASTYISVAQSILDHAFRKNCDPLKYMRKANNYSKAEKWLERVKQAPEESITFEESQTVLLL